MDNVFATMEMLLSQGSNQWISTDHFCQSVTIDISTSYGVTTVTRDSYFVHALATGDKVGQQDSK